jgi:hypothetical protein
MNMSKKYLISGAVLLGAVLASLATGSALAQSYGATTQAQAQTSGTASANATSTTQIASQVSTMGTMVSELGSIEAGRQAVIGNVSSQLGQIGVQTQSQVNMPMDTDTERATIANNLSQLSTRIGNLSVVVQGVATLGNLEASILGGLQVQLLNLKNEF